MNSKSIAFAALLLLCGMVAPLYAQAPPPPAPGYEEPVPENGAPLAPVAPAPGYYESRVPGPSGEAVIADLIFVRPLSLVGLGIGTAFSIVATPFALVSGTTSMVYDKLIVEPYNYTFCRPLGTAF